MKANYPVEYLAALLTADSGDTEQISIFVGEAKRMGVKVLPPDVNESGSDFTVVGNKKILYVSACHPSRTSARAFQKLLF